MTDSPSTTADSSISDADLIALLRKRLHDVEQAAEDYLQVVSETGEKRQQAAEALVQALSTDFKTAILCSHDMTPEQRAFWLSEIAKGNATDPQPPASTRGDDAPGGAS